MKNFTYILITTLSIANFMHAGDEYQLPNNEIYNGEKETRKYVKNNPYLLRVNFEGYRQLVISAADKTETFIPLIMAPLASSNIGWKFVEEAGLQEEKVSLILSGKHNASNPEFIKYDKKSMVKIGQISENKKNEIFTKMTLATLNIMENECQKLKASSRRK
jgi:hypothetical protein